MGMEGSGRVMDNEGRNMGGKTAWWKGMGKNTVGEILR